MSGEGTSWPRWALWLLVMALSACLLYVRGTVDFASDSPMGVAFGAGTVVMIAAAALTGWLRKSLTMAASFARTIHCPLAAVAVALAATHWHFRWRDYFGLATAALLITVALSLSWDGLRRYRPLKVYHKYGGYALVVLGLFHGVRALFFAGN